MTENKNLHSTFLTRARETNERVTMFLMNGFQMRGVIVDFDEGCVILDSDGKQQLIYRHAISTIVPMQPLDLAD